MNPTSNGGPGRAPLFTFAVVSDTHIGPVDGVSPSPWSSNRLANDRARAVVSRLNALDLAFVVHLGDMIHPTPDQPAAVTAAERFRAIFAPLKGPLHLVPGNHDIGDKPNPWTPARICDEEAVGKYLDLFGADYGAFSHGPIHVIMVNSQIINSGSAREAEQWAWLEAELAANASKRLFLFGHQPLRLTYDDEVEHYDNSAEPGRGRMLELLKRYKVESWMSGHVHTFFYDRSAETELYVLPAVSAQRLDYSELVKVPPLPEHEFGRNDGAKLGFFLVEVFEDGHIARNIRSFGETQAEGAAAPEAVMVVPMHPKDKGLMPIGVELRDPWAKPIDIAYSGVVDAFGRKPARNDYRLLGLWELGLCRLRVPLADVLDAEVRHRMETLSRCGHVFSTFTYGLPDAGARAGLKAARPLLSHIAIVLPAAEIPVRQEALKALKAELGGLPIFLSLLHSSAEHGNTVDGRFAHVIDQGFHPGDEALLDKLGLAPGAAPFVDGVVFETIRGEKPSAVIEGLITATSARKLAFSLTVKMGGPNPAVLSGTREETAALACDALETAARVPAGCEVILDTLTDIDRGYFPRLGLLDRRMNPTPAADAFRLRHQALVQATA